MCVRCSEPATSSGRLDSPIALACSGAVHADQLGTGIRRRLRCNARGVMILDPRLAFSMSMRENVMGAEPRVSDNLSPLLTPTCSFWVPRQGATLIAKTGCHAGCHAQYEGV
jgi:hypothetical protein